MTHCEQELCLNWDGGTGCPCAVLDLTPVDGHGLPLHAD